MGLGLISYPLGSIPLWLEAHSLPEDIHPGAQGVEPQNLDSASIWATSSLPTACGASTPKGVVPRSPLPCLSLPKEKCPPLSPWAPWGAGKV